MSAEDTKAKILNCTVELIKERGGDISGVTIRMIADRAGVGVGLTNHYFKTKDALVLECVETVFKDLLGIFFGQPSSYGDSIEGLSRNPVESTKYAAGKVMEFFLQNEALAKVAIRKDSAESSHEDYTTRLTNAFAYSMVDRKKMEEMLSNDRISEKMKQQFRDHFISEQRMKAFMIVSSLKEAFLRKDFLQEVIGVDITDEESRTEYLDELVEMLM